MGGIGERKRSNFDQNTLHACMKFPNDKLIRKGWRDFERLVSPRPPCRDPTYRWPREERKAGIFLLTGIS